MIRQHFIQIIKLLYLEMIENVKKHGICVIFLHFTTNCGTAVAVHNTMITPNMYHDFPFLFTPIISNIETSTVQAFLHLVHSAFRHNSHAIANSYIIV